LLFGYDGHGHRCRRLPNADTNRIANRNTNSNRNANCDTNSYGDGHSDRNADWDSNSYSNCHRHSNRNADWFSTYSNSAASADTSASPVGRCISSDRCFADG
jgi:hypothetical protein